MNAGMTTFPDLTALRAALDAAVAGVMACAARAAREIFREVNTGLEKLRRGFERASEGLRKLLGFPPLADRPRRLFWTGIAVRHAARPPTRGYWVRRCFCLACRERKGLA